jgi:hypothetical protein
MYCKFRLYHKCDNQMDGRQNLIALVPYVQYIAKNRSQKKKEANRTSQNQLVGHGNGLCGARESSQ